MDTTESQYKYNLAIGLVYYLLTNLIQHHPNKIEMIQHVIKQWDASVTENLRKLNIEQAQMYAKKYDMDVDVASILLSAHSEERRIIKKEFINETTQILINTMLQNNSKE